MSHHLNLFARAAELIRGNDYNPADGPTSALVKAAGITTQAQFEEFLVADRRGRVAAALLIRAVRIRFQGAIPDSMTREDALYIVRHAEKDFVPIMERLE